jgi:hypothetical protein
MQNRIERAGTELGTVTAKLLDHGEAVDWFLDRMMQQVKSDQTGIQKSVVHRSANACSLWDILPIFAIDFRYN